MPDCGRCLNVGRAGKRGAPPDYGPVQPRQRCATSSASTDSEQGQHAICGKPARSWTSYRVNTWTRALMALKSPLPFPRAHGSEAEFRSQETRIAEHCVIHDVLQLAELRFLSETYRDAEPAPDGTSVTN
jgi:hypothetical protein